VDFLNLVVLEWFFSSLSFHFVNKVFVSFKFHIYNILLYIVHTQGKLEVILFFTINGVHQSDVTQKQKHLRMHETQKQHKALYYNETKCLTYAS